MRIVTDCFAFDEYIQAGIYNVTRGILEGLRVVAPSLQHMLLVRNAAPDAAIHQFAASMDADIVQARTDKQQGLLADVSQIGYTDEPAVCIAVGGRKIRPAASGDGWGEWLLQDTIADISLTSRSWVPAEVLAGSTDRRRLGVAVTRISVTGPYGKARVDLADSCLDQTWHHAETDLRWTTGDSAIPAEVLAGFGLPLTIKVTYLTPSRPLERENGEARRDVQNLRKRARAFVELVAEKDLQSRLSRASIFHSHHFGPRIVPGLLNIATAYDMLPILKPHRFGTDAVEHFRRFADVMRRCDRVLAISEHTRQDTIECLGVPEDRVITAPISCDSAFAPLPAEACAETLGKFKLDRPYMLCVGTVEPRKNQLQVFRAWEGMRLAGGLDDLALVFVGKRGWGFDDFLAAVRESPLASDVHLLHAVTTPELVRLYNGAIFSAYLSEYEGFGLPVLESMACGVPVITTNGSSMREIGEGASLLVDPSNLEQIMSAMLALNRDAAARTRLTAAGLARRRQFSWENCAERYRDAIAQGRS